MAERTQLKGFTIYTISTIFMTSIIYPVVAHWGWSGVGPFDGTSVSPGLMDFAGSGLVHMTGGVGALVGVIAVRPHKDRWEKPEGFSAHSVPFCALGTFFLWFVWYGFDPGSTGHEDRR